jgi:hypothetical protein
VEFHELYSLTNYYLGDQIKNIEMGGACSTYGGQERGLYMVFMGGKYEGKRPLERPRSRWKDTIKVDLQVGWQDMDWTEMYQNRNG